MTDTVQRLIDELEALPDEKQEEWAASYLEDLRRRGEKSNADEDPYSALKILRDARLDGPEDASVTYEEKLYGLTTEDDEK
ncbi:MAG: hypothetical protein BRD48_03680 [Bacteroidetes bacterium QS_9_68_14]|nr:MAG: hypothetical protein BRD48_03680 [Bacteroidetes bacterium QS_9_68_14]